MSMTPKLGMTEISESQALKYLAHNQGLRVLDGLVQAVALSDSETTPPVSPSDGDQYILPSAPDSTWGGIAGDIARCQNGGWVITTPAEGWSCYVVATNRTMIFDGLAWKPAYGSWEARCSSESKPGAAAVLLRVVVARETVIPHDLEGSAAASGDTAAGTAVFSVEVGGVAFGTITWAPAGVTGAFLSTDSGDTVLNPGDILTVVAPGSQDASLAKVAITLLGWQ